ncbi:MAG: metallophosphoesterase [Candidatus Margulisiibacteriota bacterium]
MLEHLNHYSAVLKATGPRGSYREACNSPDRWQHYHQYEVAFKLARSIGLIKDRYFSADRQKIDFKISENLIKTQKVAAALAEMVSEGWVTEVKNGKIIFSAHSSLQGEVSRKEVAEKLFEKLKMIKGFGELNPETAWPALNGSLMSMLVVEDKVSPLQGISHFISTWGLYDILLNRMSIDMAAGRVLYQHKADDAKVRISSTQNLPDHLCSLAESEARTKDIEEIKVALQATTDEEIPVIVPADGRELPKYDFVISDVHLREYHHENTHDLLRFIYMVKRLNGRLIINGDFFDVWRSGDFLSCYRHNTRITNALTKLKEVVFIAGNHDEQIAELVERGGILFNPRFKVRNEYNSADRRIRIMHGHQFDKFNRPGSWLGRWATRLVTKMEMSWLKSSLGWLNRATANKFESTAKFFSNLFGPQISSRFLLLPRLFLPGDYIAKRQVTNILDWIDDEVNRARQVDKLDLSADQPLVFIIGHLHYEGISFLSEQVRLAVEEKYRGAVKLIITDSWDGGAGYVGDYVVLTEPGAANDNQPETEIRKAIWQRLGEPAPAA